MSTLEESMYVLLKVSEGTRAQLEEVEHVCMDIAEPTLPPAELAAAAIELAKSGIPLDRMGEALGTVKRILTHDRGFSAAQAAELVAHASAVFGRDGAMHVPVFVDRVVSLFLDAR